MALPLPILSQKILPVVLIVDDQTTTFDLLDDALSHDYTLLSATEGEQALMMAANRMPTVILLDVMMPGIDGYEVCRRLKAAPTTSDVPVIFISSRDDIEAETKGLELGGADYITKPINPRSVRARIDNQVKLQAAQVQLNLLASTDSLTGLANRRRFDEMLAYEYARHARSGTELSLVLLDIDYFKSFNDTYGHVCGDDCLRQIGQAITRLELRSTDLAARYGGEEFVFLLPETSLQGAIAFAEKIRRCISDLNMPHRESSVANHVTASVGAVSTRCFPGRPVSTVVAQADQQLYAAKAAGRNQVSASHAV